MQQAAVPPSARAPRLAMLQTAATFAQLGLFGIALVGLGLLLPGRSGVALLVVGGMTGSMLLIAALLGGIGRAWQRQADRLFAGEHLVRWRCAVDEWQQFLHAHRRPRHRWWWLPLATAGMAAAVCLGPANGEAGPPLLLALPVALSLGLGWWAARAFTGNAERHFQQLLQQPDEVLIGSNGICLCGEFWPWNSIGQHGADLRYVAGPQPHLIATFTGEGGGRSVVVPVPRGREREAMQLARRLTGRQDAGSRP